MMEFQCRDRSLYLPADDTLVLADLHLGKDATSNLEWNIGEHADVTSRFDALLERFNPSEAIIAGDLLHSFSTLPRGVMESVTELERIAEAHDTRIVVTPGNHDSMLGSVWQEPTESEYRIGDLVVCHGHEVPESTAEGYVVGHDHPTISIEGRRCPCYLWGPGAYQGADVLVLPSFTKLAAGVEVNRLSAASFQSPLVTNADVLHPLIRDEDCDETLSFPPLGQFRDML